MVIVLLIPERQLADGKKIAIGIQSFNKIREGNYYYIDKTSFIKEWWDSGDDVTLITRPRRFGKTLNMSMVEQFFSVNYAGRGDLFEGLAIWEEEAYRQIQGTYPVISISFANVKEPDYETANFRIRQILMKQYEKNAFLLESEKLSDAEKAYFKRMTSDMSVADAPMVLYQLADFLCRYYGKKTIILLDEYDTPMQEAYVNGYWKELAAFTRSLFNSTFKTNPYMARGIMTGITRVSKESIFSDLNNLEVVTTTSNKYAAAFGFTEKEVFAALDECGLGDEDEDAIWSLLLAAGYLKVVSCERLTADWEGFRRSYELALTNREVRNMFYGMVQGWFQVTKRYYSNFVKALLRGNIEEMNIYMNEVSMSMFSYFDTGNSRPTDRTERIRKYGFAFEGKNVLIG